MKFRATILLTCVFLSCGELSAQGYSVTFECDDKSLKKALSQNSQTLQLKEKTTPSALRRRAQNDQERFEELAHYYGYYSANISFSIHGSSVLFRCNLGPKYVLESFTVEGIKPSSEPKLKIGQPISTQQIVDAENSLLWQLKKSGYALAAIAKRECIANTEKHSLAVTLHVEPGPQLHFGPSTIVGAETVLPETINKYIIWKEGSPYSPQDIESTQQHLEKTGLFSSVIITEEQGNITNNQLPLTINLQESKHRSVGAGIAYTTAYGPGVKAQWENKNLRGLGDKLTFRTEIWEKYQTVLLSMTRPHFHGCDQDLLYVAEYDKLRNIAFDSRSYNLSAIVQKRISSQTEALTGIRLEWLDSHNFEGNHLYRLLKLPLQLKWSSANNLLDPTKGQTYNLKLTPSTNMMRSSFFYVVHTSTLSGYHSLFNNRLTLAAKVVFANIVGAPRNTIPPPDRFYGGSENVMRGFRAYTISPLHDKRTPIGGRSMLAGSLEARLRTAGDLGYVCFYDVGNVYKRNVPELTIHQYHSVGLGLRYATPIGPLRFDVAVPINRRASIDPKFQIYFSIGQSF